MSWETPSFVKINMNAEIGGYNPDFDDREPSEPITSEEVSPRHLIRKALERAIEHVVSREAVANAFGRVHHERVRLAQREQSEAVIQIAVREQEPGDR